MPPGISLIVATSDSGDRHRPTFMLNPLGGEGASPTRCACLSHQSRRAKSRDPECSVAHAIAPTTPRIDSDNEREA
jgi:hypothetical protein